jgi:Kef-type K+ transport system membrane component KefB
MESQQDLLLVLALVLLTAKLAAHAGNRFGVPSAVGKISVGLIAGPGLLGLVHNDAVFADFAGIGVVVLMFIAGLETDMDTMKKVSLPAVAVAAGGVILPFLGGVAVGYGFYLGLKETLFLGAILTATSVSISAETLRELGRLRSKEGTTILAAAVIDDVMGIIVLAFVFSLAGGEAPLLAVGRMALFIPAAVGLGLATGGPLARAARRHFNHETQLSLVLAIALVYAWAALRLGGVAEVTGAYIAGVLVSRTNPVHEVNTGLNWLAYSFFVPLFFVGIGLQADFGSIRSDPLLLVSILGVAVCGKVVGCYVMARLCRFSHVEALRVGIGMMSRGEVALVVAAAGASAGVVDGALFSSTVLMALVTTIITPLLLKLTYSEAENAAGRLTERPPRLPVEFASQPAD